MAYDAGAAFARIEKILIASMMRNLRRHLDEEAELEFDWSQWQVEQLKYLEEYRKANVKRFGPQFQSINAAIREAIEHGYQNGQNAEELKILEALARDQRVRRQLRGTPLGGAGDAFFRINDQKLEALLQATERDMQRAEYAVLRRCDDQYRQIIFNAQVYANTGAGTVQQAIDMATKDFLSRGIDCIEYRNGARHTISDYADMAIRTAERRAYLTGEGKKRQEWGVSLVIVNKRSGHVCPRCARWLGKILIDDVYSGGKPDGKHQLLSEAMQQGFLHPRCKDGFTTYFPGVSSVPDPVTREELQEAAQAEERENREAYARRQAEKYDRMAKYSLDPENKRMYAVRADKWNSEAEHLDAMSTAKVGSSTGWEGTEPTVHDEKSRAQMVSYAESRGIQFENIEAFDGASDMLADELDTIAEIKKRFKLAPEEASRVRFYRGPRGDFGESSPDRRTVLFNTYGLRSRTVTREILNEDHVLSATTEHGIAAHEMGHIIASKYKLNGLEIARQAYYNIYGDWFSIGQVIEKLYEEVSTYSTSVPFTHRNKPLQYRLKYYREVIPEVMGLHWTSKTEFTTEFLRVMEEMIP